MLIRPCRLLRQQHGPLKTLPLSINYAAPPPSDLLQRRRYTPSSCRPLSTQTIARVRITEDRQTAEFFSSPESSNPTVTRHISPTPKAKLPQLETGLARLLGVIEQAHAEAGVGREQEEAESPSTFATAHWQLDPPSGASISRHFTFETQQAQDEAIQRIESLADEARHHPHVALGSTKREPLCMTVTCTTHQPRGLGVRDLKLATKIGEALTERSESGVEQVGRGVEDGEHASAAEREAVFTERARFFIEPMHVRFGLEVSTGPQIRVVVNPLVCAQLIIQYTQWICRP